MSLVNKTIAGRYQLKRLIGQGGVWRMSMKLKT